MKHIDSLDIRLVDWENQEDCQTVVSLLDAYAKDPMGGSAPSTQYVRDNLATSMAATPGAFSAVGFLNDKPVALANCFTTLSTFACKPIVNIHDLAVLPQARGRGVGQQMLSFVEQEASRLGACKVTLEVLTGNAIARTAYERFGFVACTLDESTGHAVFLQKTV